MTDNQNKISTTEPVIVQNVKSDSAAPMAIISLVLGIIGLILACCCPYCAPAFSIAAMVIGYIEKNNIKDGKSSVKGQGLAQAGWILGIVGLAVAILFIIIGIILNLMGIMIPAMNPNKFSNI